MHIDRRARLEAGPMLELITTPIRALQASLKSKTGEKAKSAATPKIYLYSAHDSTVSPLVGALAPWSNTTTGFGWPPYASQLIIEKWLKAGQLGIRIIYNNEQLPIKACNNQLWCNAQQWLDNVKRDLIPQDIIKECAQS
jgi:hypothetical protein